ncbi:MAG: hypothetical protein MJ123_05570 [Lachnospiraceae bacterium]|nr:hypothetical protein [Lachnospiraceae bacterium]
MKRLENIIFTIIFIVGIGAFSVLTLIDAKDDWYEFFSNLTVKSFDECEEAISQFDEMAEETIYKRNDIVELYGLINKSLGKKEINGFEYVIDKNGYITNGNFWNVVHDRDINALALNVELFREYLDDRNIPMLFVSFPQKMSDEWNEKYNGIPYDDYTYEMERLLIQLRKYRVPYVNLDETLHSSGLNYDELYFKTDHHWTSKAAFLGYKDIINKLGEMGQDIGNTDYYTDLSNYTIERYENMMLGSSGRSVGINYANGVEDFELYYLDDDAVYEVFNGKDDYNSKQTGVISDVLINKYIPEKIESDFKKSIYSYSLYDMYLKGIRSELSIRNTGNEGGKSVLFLCDSYATPIATWMAPMCKNIDFLWTKKVSRERIEEYITQNDYDLVIVGLYPNDFSEESIHFPEKERPIEEATEEIQEEEKE